MAASSSSGAQWANLRIAPPGMMTLISLAIIVAFATSLAATFGVFEIDVWWELASLITIMVLGHWLEMRAISQARGALNALAGFEGYQRRSAHDVRDGRLRNAGAAGDVDERCHPAGSGGAIARRRPASERAVPSSPP